MKEALGRWLRQPAEPAAPPPAVPEKARQPATEPVASPPPKPAPAKPAPKPAPRTVVAVTMLGLDGDSLESVAGLVERQCVERNMQPVCIVDQHDFGPFRRRGMIVDQVVDAERRAKDSPELPWHLYRRAQFVLLGRRWHPGLVISFGRPPEADCLEALERPRG